MNTPQWRPRHWQEGGGEGRAVGGGGAEESKAMHDMDYHW